LGSAAADADAEIEADTVALTEADIDDDIVMNARQAIDEVGGRTTNRLNRG